MLIQLHILRDFLWTLNFCLFWPTMQIRKKGGWNLKKKSSSLKLLSQSQPSFAKMILGGHLKKFLFLVMAAILDTGRRWRTQFWNGTTQGSFQQSLVEIGSVSAVLYPRWRPWLKIEISSNGQNCSILSQKVPKFELITGEFSAFTYACEE
jgi:hypothetical protein